MKILVINPILYTSTNKPVHKVQSLRDTLTYGLCNGLVRLGHQVTLASVDDYRPTGDERYPFEICWFKNTFRFLPSPLPMPWSLYGYLRHESGQFDLIVANEMFSFTTLFAAMVAPSKTLVRQELSLHQRKWHRLPSRLWHRLVVPLAMRHVHSVVPCSSRARQFIERYSRCVASVDVPLGTDIGEHVVDSAKLRQFISVGRLVEGKNIDVIIRRFAQFVAMPQYADYRLLLAGRGPLRSTLESLTEQLGIAHSVQFLGQVDHATLASHLSHSVASLVASTQELNMMCVAESVACGTPVITNHVPNDSVMIEQNGLGIVRDDWDAADMAQVATDQSYAARCQAYAPHLTCESVARQLLDIYQSH